MPAGNLQRNRLRGCPGKTCPRSYKIFFPVGRFMDCLKREAGSPHPAIIKSSGLSLGFWYGYYLSQRGLHFFMRPFKRIPSPQKGYNQLNIFIYSCLWLPRINFPNNMKCTALSLLSQKFFLLGFLFCLTLNTKCDNRPCL